MRGAYRCCCLPLSVWLALLSAGCGPERLLPPPDELPEMVEGRALWHTPQAYLYASDKLAAGEIDRCVKEVAEYIETTHQGELGKGLIIVIDKGEEDILGGRLREKLRQGGQRGPQWGEPSSGDDAESTEMEEAVAVLVPVSLAPEDLTDLGLNDKLPSDVAWSVVCPSHALIDDVLYRAATAAVEKELGKLGAIGVSGILPIILPQMGKTFLLTREVIVFQGWSEQQAHWSKEERGKAERKFMAQRLSHHLPMTEMFMDEDEEGIMPPRREFMDVAASQPASGEGGEGSRKLPSADRVPPPTGDLPPATSQPASAALNSEEKAEDRGPE